METFSALLAICTGNSPVTAEFPAKTPEARSFVISLIAWINGWVINRDAGDLRRHCAHYDVIVKLILVTIASQAILGGNSVYTLRNIIADINKMHYNIFDSLRLINAKYLESKSGTP